MTGYRDLEHEAFGLALHRVYGRRPRADLSNEARRRRMGRVTWWCRVERLRLLRLWRAGEREFMVL